jgi:hypothetical protein
VAYTPGQLPGRSEDLLRFLYDELRRIAEEFANPQVRGLRFYKLYKEPAKFEDGDVVYADGTEWDPGAGVGLYARIGNAWVKL